MKRYQPRVRAALAAGAAGLGLMLGGCSVKDELLAPQQPGVISPGELDVSLGGDALQLRVMCLETVGDLFQPGPGRWAERTVPLFQEPLLVGIQ